LVDVFPKRLNYPDLKRAIIAQAERFSAREIVIEDKSSGTQLIQDLTNERMLDVLGYKPPPGADKVMRLHACSDRFENGRVFLPANASWLDEYVVELVGFPGTKYDDQVDSTTQAWILCGRTMSWRPTSRRSVDSAGSSIGATAQKTPLPSEAAPHQARADAASRRSQVRGSNPLSSTRKSAQIDVISRSVE
jgi:predicted phage terminase large subunit-like protein